MIKSIIFDIGNVLAWFNWEEVFKKYFNEEEFALASQASIANPDVWNEVDLGKKSFDSIMDTIKETQPELGDKIKTAVLEIYNNIKPFDYAKDWLKEYKDRGYMVYILSNYGDYPYQLSKDRFTFLEHSDGELISYEVKTIKPNADIYSHLLRKFNLKADECIFIDDKEENVEGAINVGMKSVHFTNFESVKKQIEEILNT